MNSEIHVESKLLISPRQGVNMGEDISQPFEVSSKLRQIGGLSKPFWYQL